MQLDTPSTPILAPKKKLFPKYKAVNVALFLFGAALIGLGMWLPFLFMVFAPFIIAATSLLFLRGEKNLFVTLLLFVSIVPIAYMGDFVASLFALLIFLSSIGIILGVRQKSLLAAGFLVMLMGLSSFIVPTTIILSRNTEDNTRLNPAIFLQNYILDNYTRPDVIFFGRIQYALKELEEGEERISSSDENFNSVIAEVFAADAVDWVLAGNFFFFLFGVASFMPLAGLLLVIVWGKKDEALMKKAEMFKLALYNSTQKANLEDDGEVKKEGLSPLTATELYLGKKFLVRLFLPVMLLMVFIMFFTYVTQVFILDEIGAAVLKGFITVPAFFAGVSLLLYLSSLIDYKAPKVILYILIALLAVICLVIPFLMMIISMFGIADAILNVRKHIKEILKE